MQVRVASDTILAETTKDPNLQNEPLKFSPKCFPSTVTCVPTMPLLGKIPKNEMIAM